MNYILILVVFVLNQRVASDDSRNRRNINESFDVNIGAGYAVGLDQSQNINPPNGTSNIRLSKNYYSSPLVAEALPRTGFRAPRVLTNFTPQIATHIPEKPSNLPEPQSLVADPNYKDYTAESSNNHNFYTSAFQVLADENLEQPSSVNFEKVLSEIGSTKPYSKVLQVIKVPAIYEIHLQSDANDVSKNRITVNPTANLFWKNYNENTSNAMTQNSDGYNDWLHSALTFSDDYSKSSSNSHMHKEEHFSKDGEGSYDFSNTPVVSYENLHENFDDQSEGSDIPHPATTHHYSNTRTFPNNFDNDKDVKINYSYESHDKPGWTNKENHRTKKQYSISNFKRHVGQNSYALRGLSSTNKLLANDILSAYSSNIKNYAPFKHNQAITEDGKPQALHVVPAPILGNYPQPKSFEIQRDINLHPRQPTTTTLYKQTKVKFNKPSPSTKPLGYKVTNGFLDYKPSHSLVKLEKVMGPEALTNTKRIASFSKESQNLIYGKKNNHILTPHEINISVTPGSAMVTVTENTVKADTTSLDNVQHFLNIKRNWDTTNTDKPKNIASVQRQSLQIVDQQYVYPVNSKNDMNLFIDGSSQISENELNPYKDSMPQNNPDQNKSISSLISDAPYQPQRSVSAEDVHLTTSGPDSTLQKSNNFASTDNRQVEPTIKTEKNVDTNVVFSRAAARIFPSKQSFRRRTFNPSYNMNHWPKNKHIDNGYFKSAHHSRMFQRKNSSPHLNYMIYITRKSTH